MKMKMEDNVHKSEKVTPSLLDAFDLVKSLKDDEKLTGGAKIISQLQSNQNDKDVQYALKRVIRSLGANVPDMRIGYFATLVLILKKCNQITISQLFDLIKKELHATGSSKTEVGDVALGQILVCGAVFRSGLIQKCSEDQQKDVLQMLLSASTKKSYLGTVAYLTLLDFVNNLDAEQFESIIWSNIKQDFKKDIKEHTLDSLYFLMVLSRKFPEKVKLRKLIGVPEILCEDNIHSICEKIMSGVDLNSINHPIYNEIGTQIANSAHLKIFWISGIDGQLVKHKRNRELVAVNMLITILNNMTQNFEVIPEIISRNYFKLFIDWFKGLQTASKIRTKRDDEDDHKIMIKKQKEMLNVLAKTLKSDKVDSKIRVEVMKKLLFNPGEMNFTDITGTNIIKSIITDLDKDGVKKLAKLFKGVLLSTSKKFIKEGVERIWYNNERSKAAELISYLVIHETVKDDTEFKLTYMKILMCFGFLKIGSRDNMAISSELSGSIKISFYRCLTSRFSSADNLVDVLSALSSFINVTFTKEELNAKLEKQFPTSNMECWKMVDEVCKNIEKNDSKSKVDKVFLILLYQLGLFLFSEPSHVKMAKSSIKELKSCYEHYRNGGKKTIIVKEGETDEDEPEWIEVLIEVLLSILSIESSVLRSVVQCVFRLTCEYLTPSCIDQIMSVLDPDNELNPLLQESDSENEEGNEEIDSNEKDKINDEDTDDSDMEEEEEEDMKTPDQLKLAVQKALGVSAPDTDTESIDADMIDEEEGKKLDEALAEAFRQFHQGKGRKSKKDRKDKKALSDFRVRVLDLIDIYLEKDPSMDICLNMIAPLTRSLEFCIQDNQFSELENRLRKTIKILTKIRKFSSVDNVTTNVLSDYLRATLAKGERSHFMFQAIGDVVTNFATFIIHCSQKIETAKFTKKKKSISPLEQILKEALQSYFQNRNCILPIIFFHNVLQTDWVGTFELIPIIIDNIFNNNVRHFRRSEGIELMAGFYRALKRYKSESDHVATKLSKLEASFENELTKILNGNSEFEAKLNFFNTLKKLINTIKNFHESSHIQCNIDFKSLLEIIDLKKSNTKIKSKSKTREICDNVMNGKENQIKKNKKKRKKTQVNGDLEMKCKKIKLENNV